MHRSSSPILGGGNGGEGYHGFTPFLTVIILSLLLIGSAHGNTIAVSSGESIQTAVEMAKDGDTVLVDKGVYKENLILDKEIALKGTGSPKVDAGGSGSAITLKAEGIILEGFTVTGSGSGEKDAGIRVVVRNCTIRDNIVIGNSIGILLQDARKVVVSGNFVERNGVGVYLETSWGNEVSYNHIAENGEGIHISRNNVSESIKAADDGGVSIKYTPKTEVLSHNVSEIGFAGAYQDNLIYQNELLGNGQNAYDDGDNLWHKDGKGNWYDDFDAIEEGCRDRNKDGICDSSHPIPDGASEDQYPLASEDAVLRYKAVSGDYQLSIYRSTFSPQGEISFSFEASENFSGWVNLTLSDQDSMGAEDALSNIPIDGPSGTTTLQAPSEEGSYILRMYDDVGTEIVSLPFEVATPSLSVSPTSASTCDKVKVSYSGAPGFEGDWIGLYKVGSQDSNAISRQYLEGSSSGTLTFTAPSDAGSYEFRMFEDGGYTRLVVSDPVVVKALSGVKIEASPSKVKPGGTIEVSFWGAKPESAVGMYEMTSPDKFMLAMQFVNGRSCGTMTFKAPSAPGRYDFRLFENNVYRKHMGVSNVVTVG